MKTKTFVVTEEQEEKINNLQIFFNQPTHQKTLSRILDFASNKLIE